MGEGVGQLVFILIIMAAAALDAMGRNRKKRQRMEEMDREEAEGGTATRTRPGQGPAGGGPAQGGQERETAETMVPEDFWAILTGQAPVETEPDTGREEEEGWQAERRRQAEARRDEAPSREGTGAEDYRVRGSESDYSAPGSTQDPPRRPHIPMPVPSDRYTEREQTTTQAPASGEDDSPVTRRGARWMEGIERTAEEDAIRAQEAAAYGDLDEPWGRLEDIAAGERDIAAGEIDLEEGITDAIGMGEREQTVVGRRRRARATSAYTRLLETGDLEDLRKAIVLKEVLGSPAGFRSIGHEWGED